MSKKSTCRAVITIAIGFYFVLGLLALNTPSNQYAILGNLPNQSDILPLSSDANEALPLSSGYGVINSSNRNLFYFLQLSDIHINMAPDKADLRSNFQTFCSDTISTINPAFIISTGDNVDGMSEQEYHQHIQDEQEYIFYNQTLQDNNLNSSYWFSMMGNHERYNTEAPDLFKYYIRNETQYVVNFETSFGSYRFILTDTAQDPGLKNFFDLFGETKTDKLNWLENELNSHPLSEFNQTLLLGHHPMYSVISEESDSGLEFKEIIRESGIPIYLTGHMHMDNMYANHKEITELHCPGFGDEAMYRICAIDNDIFTFSDEVLNQWPAVVVTNPINGEWQNNKMPLDRMLTQTEIRALVFDENPITSMYATIDGTLIGNLTSAGNNLWTVNYDPTSYSSGVHTLRIFVESASDSIVKEIEFDLGTGEPIKTATFKGFFLLLPIIPALRIIIAVLFVFGYLQILIPLIWNRIQKRKGNDLPLLGEEANSEKPSFKEKLQTVWTNVGYLPKLVKISMLLIPFFNIFGPVLIAPVLETYYGVVIMSWVLVNGTYVLDLYSLIWAIVFLIAFSNIINFTIHGFAAKIKKSGFFPLFVYVVAMGIYIGAVTLYFGIQTVLINPIVYINIAFPIYYLFVVARSHR